MMIQSHAGDIELEALNKPVPEATPSALAGPLATVIDDKSVLLLDINHLQLIYLLFRTDKQEIVLNMDYGISTLNVKTGALKLVAGSLNRNYATQDGPLLTASFRG